MTQLADVALSAARPADHDEAIWREGLKVGMPTLFGIGAWGLVVGIAMVKTGLTVPQALGMTLLVFAGSAQLASLPLIAASAPIWLIFATALVVNLRFVILSAFSLSNELISAIKSSCADPGRLYLIIACMVARIVGLPWNYLTNGRFAGK